MALAAKKREPLERPTWSHKTIVDERPSTMPDDLEVQEPFPVMPPSAVVREWSGDSIPMLTGQVPEALGVRATFLMTHIDGYLTVAEIASCMQLTVERVLPHFIGLAMLGAVEIRLQARISGVVPVAKTQRQEDAKLVQLISEDDEPLPTLPGIAPSPWAQHTAVILRNGSVLDPRRNTIHASVGEWRYAIVGDAPGVQVLVNGQLMR